MIFLFFGSSINTYGNHMATIPRHFLPNKKKAKTLFDYDTLGTPGSPSFSDEIVRLETRRTFSTQPTFLWNTKQPIIAMRGVYLLSRFNSFSSKTRILLPFWRMPPRVPLHHTTTQINTDQHRLSAAALSHTQSSLTLTPGGKGLDKSGIDLRGRVDTCSLPHFPPLHGHLYFSSRSSDLS